MKKASEATPNHLLRREREQRNWSQQDVADRIEASAKTISRWERGIITPTPYYRQRLCTVFGKSAKELGLVHEAAEEHSEQPVEQVSLEQRLASPVSVASPLLWNIPYRRNPFFTGREAVLRHLHDALTSGKAAALTQRQAISGLGGIGKTQTAVEYAYRYHSDYQAILWVRADTREVLVSDFVSIAGLLNLPEKAEQDQNHAVNAFKRWLQIATGWLLILDNADDLAMANEFIPLMGRGHTLLTTREQVTGTVAQRDDASYADWAKAKTIAQAMDGLPLALDQAGAYIEETACGLAGYLDLYRTRHADLLKRRGRLASDHPKPVATTWSLSFEQVAQANPAAADLLRLCAFLHPDAIPEEILTGGAPELGPVLQSVAADPFELDSAIEELGKYSLARRQPNTKTLAIHRLVQTVLRDQMDEATQRQWAERTVRAVNRAFPWEWENLEDIEDISTWERSQRCLPHVQACAVLIEQWGITFAETTQMLRRAAIYLGERAQLAQAELFLQQALRIHEQNLQANSPEAAKILNVLAHVYYDQGKYAQAEPLFLRVLALREQFLKPDDLELAISLNNLGALYNIQGKYAQSEPLLQRALAIWKQAYGPMDPITASGYNNLGFLYYLQGKYVQAEPLYRSGLGAREQNLGAEHPTVAFDLHNLAVLYRAQGKYTQAEPLFQRAIAIREKTLGPDHPYVAITLNHLGLLYYAQGKYAQAEPLFQRALDIRERKLDPQHPDMANSFNALGQLYHTQGKYTQAESLLQQALEIYEKALGPDRPEVANALNNLALLYYTLGKSAQAEPLFQRALDIREKALGAEHPDVAQSLNDLGKLYSDLGHYEQAEPFYQLALAIREKTLGPVHPLIAQSLENYADLLRQTKREAEAAEWEVRAGVIRERHTRESVF